MHRFFGVVFLGCIALIGCDNENQQMPDQAPFPFDAVVVYSEQYQIDLGGLERLHPFDINKYKHIHDQLLTDGLLSPEDALAPEPLTDDQIQRVHTQEFLQNLDSPEMVAQYLEAQPVALLPPDIVKQGVITPFRHASGGTLLAARQAMEHGIAINIGGGYHHAYPDHGEGFCIFADMPIAIRLLQDEKAVQRVLVIDLDVHQGNGTAVCLADDSTTYTFSMHQGDIYPIPKEKSDLDVELAAGTDDQQFLDTLSKHLPLIFEAAKPDLVIYQAGCDTLADDPLAELAMTESGIVQRDAMVIDACVERGIPVVMVLGGGYSELAWHAQYESIKRTLQEYGLAPSQ